MDTENRLSNVSFLIFGITFICIILSCMGAFDHYLIKGYCIPGIPLEAQPKGCENGNSRAQASEQGNSTITTKQDFVEAGQNIHQATGINPLDVVIALIVVCVVLYVLGSMIMGVSRVRNKLTKTDPILPVTNDPSSRIQYNKGQPRIESERRMKSDAIAIPLMISIAVIIFIVVLDAIHYCQPLFGIYKFCF